MKLLEPAETFWGSSNKVDKVRKQANNPDRHQFSCTNLADMFSVCARQCTCKALGSISWNKGLMSTALARNIFSPIITLPTVVLHPKIEWTKHIFQNRKESTSSGARCCTNSNEYLLHFYVFLSILKAEIFLLLRSYVGGFINNNSLKPCPVISH